MNKKEMEALALKTASRIKTEQDLNDFSRLLKNITVEAALGVELDEHLGYDKHAVSGNTNSRNGTSSKTLLSEDGAFEIDVPLRLTCRVTAIALSSRSWLKSTKPALPAWTIKSCFCMRGG